MDWSKAKTIFIIMFLILDGFLVFEIMNQRNESQVQFKKESSLEEKLESENIKVVNLPRDIQNEKFVEAALKPFTTKDLSNLKGQETSIHEGTTIRGIFTKPIPLKNDWNEEDIDDFVKQHLIYGDQYRFWSFNQESNTITLCQVYDDKLFLENNRAQIKIFLNEDNEIESYEQTMLDHIRELKEVEIMTATEAVEALFHKGLLNTGSEITDVKLGYYSLIPSTSTQLLAPTWNFVINGEENLFVNAVEGHVIQGKSNENKVLE